MLSAIHFDLQKSSSAFRWGSILGIFCGLVGLFLTVFSQFGFLSSYQYLDNLGALFLVTACLVSSFAAHSFDKVREAGNGKA